MPPAAVVVTAAKVAGKPATELIDWMKSEDYKFPVIAVVDNLNALDVYNMMKGGGAVDIIQRTAIDKQLIETVNKYVKAEYASVSLGKLVIPRQSEIFHQIDKLVDEIAATQANVIIFGESGNGKEYYALEIYKRSNRNQKPCDVFEAGGAALVGQQGSHPHRGQ